MLNVAIHIRRGDVTRERHPEWYVPIGVYHTIISLLQSNHRECRITVISEGPPWSHEILGLLQRFPKMHLPRHSPTTSNDKAMITSDILDFACMASNDVVIGSKSTYSWLASRVGNCKFIPVLSAGQHMPHGLCHEGIVHFNPMTDEVTTFLIGTLNYLP
jgi:hypothetical protein